MKFNLPIWLGVYIFKMLNQLVNYRNLACGYFRQKKNVLALKLNMCNVKLLLKSPVIKMLSNIDTKLQFYLPNLIF